MDIETIRIKLQDAQERRAFFARYATTLANKGESYGRELYWVDVYDRESACLARMLRDALKTPQPHATRTTKSRNWRPLPHNVWIAV